MLLIPILLILIGGVLLYQHQKPSERPYVPQNSTPSPTTLTAENIISLVNQERTKAGVAQLQTSPELMRSSAAKCQDMVTNHYFAHVSPSGVQPYDFIKAEIARSHMGENLAKGTYENASEPVNDWMNSPEHKDNILDKGYNLTGLAICELGQLSPTRYIVQHFTN